MIPVHNKELQFPFPQYQPLMIQVGAFMIYRIVDWGTECLDKRCSRYRRDGCLQGARRLRLELFRKREKIWVGATNSCLDGAIPLTVEESNKLGIRG